MSSKEAESSEDWSSQVILWGLGFLLAVSVLVSGNIRENHHAYLQLFLLLLFSYHLASRSKAKKRGETFPLPPLAPLYPLGALLALCLFSLATTANYVLTVRNFHQWLSYGILVYLVIYGVRPSGHKLLIQLMVGLGGLLGLYGIYQYFWGFPYLLEYLEVVGEDTTARGYFQSGRVFSTFFSQDMLAGYLSMTIPLGLVLFINNHRYSRFTQKTLSRPLPSGQKELSVSFPQWLLTGISLLSMLGSLFLTRSLGGWLSLLGSLGLWGFIGVHRVIQSPEQKRRFHAIILSFFFGGTALVGTILWVRSSYFLELSHSDNSLVQYRHNWESSLHIAADFPLTGSGLGTFGLLYPRYKSAAAGETQYAHNGYLQLAAELGFPSLIAFLWITVVFLKRGWKAVAHTTQNQPLSALGLLAAGTAFLFHSMVGYGLFIPQVAFAWWVVFGLTLSQGQPAIDHYRFGLLERMIEKWPGLSGVKSDLIAKGSQVAMFFFLLGLILSIGRGMLGQYYYQKTREAIQKGQPEQADLAIRRAIALNPSDDDYHYLRARLNTARRQQAGDIQPELIERVIREYGWAIELNPYYSFYYRDRGRFYLELGRFDRAIRDLSTAIELYPTNGNYRYDLGLTYKSMGEMGRSEAELREALRLQPNHEKALQELGWMLFLQKKIDAALPYFEQLVRIHPRDARALVDLGWVYASLGLHYQALQEYKTALRQDPQNAYAWVNRGWSYYQLKNYLEAEEAYRKALDINPDNPDAQINLVLLYIQTGKREKARAELTKSMKTMPDDPRLLGLRKKLSSMQGS